MVMTLNNNLTATEFSATENDQTSQPTVLSQSFGHSLFPPPYYAQPFWDSLVQQQTTDHIHTFAKPIGASSPDSYHESHPAVLPIGAPRMAIDDLITSPTQDSLHQFMLLSHHLDNGFIQHNSLVIKDDVFLAPSSNLTHGIAWLPSTTVIVDHDDTASLSSHSSLSSSQHSDKLTTSPCLSPVTSPTNFLYNHEPLFEGGIIEDLGGNNIKNLNSAISPITVNHQDLYFEDEEYDDLSSVLTDSTTSEDSSKQQQSIRRPSTVSDDLDWFKLLDAFRTDVACDLPETTMNDEQLSDCSDNSSAFDDDSSSDDDRVYENEAIYIQKLHVTTRTPIKSETMIGLKKRKRAVSETPVSGMYELNLSDTDNDDVLEGEDHAAIQKKVSTKSSTKLNPSPKRRKKSKAATFTPRYKKYQKKKVEGDAMMNPLITLPSNMAIHNQKSTAKNSSSTNKDKKEELDQNKESISSTTRCQLIESVTENEKKYKKTVFQHLTEVSIDWCRYCGTTEGVNWRPGPWGKRTLCNKHGCDYKGYGLASRLPRLDLSAFSTEKLEERLRPVVQQFCIVCQSPEQHEKDNHLILCSGGCSRAYHQHCHAPVITINPAVDSVRWFCSALCKENRKRNKVVVELPRKHMPLMHLLPKHSKKPSAA